MIRKRKINDRECVTSFNHHYELQVSGAILRSKNLVDILI